MEEYRSNSNLSKEGGTKKKVEKVVTGSAKVKKPNKAQKFMDSLVSEDAANVKSYIFMDVLMPALKKAISDVVTNGIDMILYGETGRSNRKSAPASRVSYRSYYDDRRETRPLRSERNTYEYGNIEVASRSDAEAVLLGMEDLIATYGMASVADLYDLADIQSEWTDNDYGWMDIRTAQMVRTDGGRYLIRMPKALPLR